MTEPTTTTHRRLDVHALVALSFAIAAVVSIGLPVIACVFALAAVLLSLTSRRVFIARPELVGTRAAVAAFLIGVVVLAINLVPTVLSLGITLGQGGVG